MSTRNIFYIADKRYFKFLGEKKHFIWSLFMYMYTESGIYIPLFWSPKYSDRQTRANNVDPDQFDQSWHCLQVRHNTSIR